MILTTRQRVNKVIKRYPQIIYWTSNTLYYSYYLSAYILMCYYSSLIVLEHQGNNQLETVAHPDYYDKLTSVTLAFLSSDMVVKYWNRSNQSTLLYYALQLHHIIGIVGYFMAYYYHLGHLIIANLSLFELSSVPLLFYSNRLLIPVSLPLTWTSYLVVRIIWGNYMLTDSLIQVYQDEQHFTTQVAVMLYLMHGFFLFANNYWFYLLTRQMMRKIVTPFWMHLKLFWRTTKRHIGNFLNTEVPLENLYYYLEEF